MWISPLPQFAALQAGAPDILHGDQPDSLSGGGDGIILPHPVVRRDLLSAFFHITQLDQPVEHRIKKGKGVPALTAAGKFLLHLVDIHGLLGKKMEHQHRTDGSFEIVLEGMPGIRAVFFFHGVHLL